MFIGYKAWMLAYRARERFLYGYQDALWSIGGGGGQVDLY